MGLVVKGEGSYHDCSDNRIIKVVPGDIIFVPITSRYVSKWIGKPDISYISMHFSFEEPGIYSRHQKFILQKVKPDNFEETKADFEYVLSNFDKDESGQLISMSKFYGVLGEILPKLESKKMRTIDSRIIDAIEYIEKNFERNIAVETLAEISRLSISRFFTCFKSAVGVTPVEYINNHRINRAIILLLNNSQLSIEDVSEAVGFESSAYFRRVFKKITGKTPREYKSNGIEI